MRGANTYLGSIGTTIFTVMSALATEHKSINLGQGFPDTEGPADIVQAAADALKDGRNQYPPMPGVPELRQAVAAANRRFYGLDIDWAQEVTVTSGATEAITACLMAVLDPGDEVVLIEPLYDTYVPVVRMLGAIPRIVRLAPPHWELPRAELADAFGPKTKAILFNSPMNPCGKVFTAEELAFIAELVQRHDTYAICDEVYEHLVFDGASAHPADDAARHAGPDDADRQRRQDVFADRMEGRLRDGGGGADAAGAEGAPEPDLHHRAQPATRGRGRTGQGRRLFRLAGAQSCRRGATNWPTGLAAIGLSTCCRPGHLFHHHRFHAAGFQRRRRRVLPPHHRTGRGDRDPGLRVL